MALTTINNAISAYNSAARSFATGDSGSSESTSGAGSDFASLLKAGAKNAIDSGKKSEEMAKQAIAGKADVRDVVAAVNNAELTLQTVVAVRDKVISAYSDILKMPI
ncbi:MAG TPA: flagellar hook-basal body complex protein FliE [Magnetospirillaceae bacterium]|nr:flagellar hook-basal body complex protein FliE [Magnetospirillaceae bacterium]